MLSTNIWLEGIDKMDSDPFQRYSDSTGSKGHKLKEVKYQLDLKVNFFTVSMVRQTLDQVTQGGSGLSILGDIQNLSYIHNWKQGPEQCDLTEPALSRGLDEMMLRDAFQIKYFMILWFYELWQTIWSA